MPVTSQPVSDCSETVLVLKSADWMPVKFFWLATPSLSLGEASSSRNELVGVAFGSSGRLAVRYSKSVPSWGLADLTMRSAARWVLVKVQVTSSPAAIG